MKRALYIGVAVFILLYVLFFAGTKTIINYPSSGTTIVAFGDSLVEGVGATRGQDFVSMLSSRVGEPIINLGISGDTTRDALDRVDEVVGYNPKVVLLLFGGNDYLRKISKEETFSNLAKVITTIQESGAVVVLLGVRGGLLRDNFEDEYARLSEVYGTAYVPNVLDDLFGNPAFMSDAIHPNDEGYKIIAERIEPVLERVIR